MKLKIIRMISSLLLGFMLVITAQGNSSSVSNVSGQNSNQNKLEVMTGITTMHQKEPIIERSGIRKLWLGAKKKLTKHEEDMDSKNTHEENISGNVLYGLKSSFGSLGEQKKDQNKHVIMESKASRLFTKFVIPRRSGPTKTNRKCSQDCNDVSINERRRKSLKISEGTSHKKDESHHHQSLVEAEKEVANLIYKDYKGKPSHKPPINNNEPGN
ncbi:hypothetical protein HN51_067918 [Arachis hypogaea]|uniref:uncharacterized protein n=2 Tax=Arachis TaxID=3817 RepID=UPI000DEC6C47|nr:uncharacterized protein LOC112740701 [Arachis hypogaea]QHO09410.1 uncharacterized protein DS421_14g481010 [Arachis hypogaea]